MYIFKANKALRIKDCLGCFLKQRSLNMEKRESVFRAVRSIAF
jgi:hypothetical protein